MDKPPGAPDPITLPPAESKTWTALNRSPRVILTALIALYLAIACTQAATKLLWTDELITLAIARQSSLAAIWRALALGADPNPPLSHWLVLQSTNAFGISALAIRLPAILCTLLAILSLWAILRRWLSPGITAIGILAFMATRGFDYAYDARSYAPLAGFTMAALACWLIASDHLPHNDARPVWPPQNLLRLTALLGMALSLAAALSSNYYGILAFFPIAIGETVLTIRTRRIYPATWLALAAAALPLLAYLPLIHHNIAEFTPHAWNRPHLDMLSDSYLLLVEGILWPVLVGALYLAWKIRKSSALNQPQTTVTSNPKPHELAALIALLLYPFLGLAIAAAGAGMISPRCVLPVCCGFGIAAALLARRASPRIATLLLCAALLWVIARESACSVILAHQRTAFLALRDRIAQQPPTTPILVSDSLFALPLAHYSSPSVRARLLFPIDFAAIHASESDDSGEQNLWAGRDGIFPLRIVPYATPSTPLIVIARPNGWLAQRLAADAIPLADITTPTDAQNLQNLGGIFTPMAHDSTRLLTSVPRVQ